MYKNDKVNSLKASTLLKIRVMSEKASSKSCSGFNFVQKSHWAHMSIMSEKASSKSCSGFNFVQKSHWAHMSIFHRSGVRVPKIAILEIL